MDKVAFLTLSSEQCKASPISQASPSCQETPHGQASPNELPMLDGAVCAFGVFDGLHRGHQAIIDLAVGMAEQLEAPSIALTFDIDPDDIFDSDHVKLMPNGKRLESLAASGIDQVIAFRFDERFAKLMPEEFLDSAFSLNRPAAIIVGEDFRFGCKGKGDLAMLRKWGESHGMEVVGIPLCEEHGSAISSTRIRGLLAEGKMHEAANLLGHPYSVSGIVEKGRSQGREMGIRTANLELVDSELACREGVYAGYVDVDGRKYKAAISCGISPTFKDTAKANVEAHILDFDGDIYDKPITVEFVEFIQPMRRFDSIDELREAIQGYIEIARSL